MPLWRLYYHVVFATRERQPFLTPDLRLRVAKLLTSGAAELGCVLHAVHAQPDHVHIVLSIPPSRAVATIIGQLKGSTSYVLAGSLPPPERFGWQSGYGAFSFGESNLPNVVAYVRDQDRRHASQELWQPLEETNGEREDDGPLPYAPKVDC